MDQATKMEGYSICKVSGNLNAVDKATKIIQLMMTSGQN